MYADRGTLATAVGIDGSGGFHRLSIATIAETDDPLIAESSARGAIRAGGADALCAQIARRADDRLVRIEVVEERRDVIARTKHRNSLLERRVKPAVRVD